MTPVQWFVIWQRKFRRVREKEPDELQRLSGVLSPFCLVDQEFLSLREIF
jgi:hypothetical protein